MSIKCSLNVHFKQTIHPNKVHRTFLMLTNSHLKYRLKAVQQFWNKIHRMKGSPGILSSAGPLGSNFSKGDDSQKVRICEWLKLHMWIQLDLFKRIDLWKFGMNPNRSPLTFSTTILPNTVVQIIDQKISKTRPLCGDAIELAMSFLYLWTLARRSIQIEEREW